MIPKITQGRGVAGMVMYHYKNDKESELFDAQGIIEAEEPKNVINTFRPYIDMSKRKDAMLHVSLNFKKEDHDKLVKQEHGKTLIKDYLSKIGFSSDHPYVAYKHNDKKHPHYHILTPKVNEQGKLAISDSYLHRRSQNTARSLEAKYGLEILSSVKGKKESIKKERPLIEESYSKIDYENKKLSMSDYIGQKVSEAYKMSDTFESFKSKLKSDSIDLKKYDYGYTYFLKNYSGINSGYINRNYLFSNVKSRIQSSIAISTKEKIQIDDYVNSLKDLNIQVNIKRDNKGVIRGISYTDEISMLKITGEQLGAKYRASNIGKLLNQNNSKIKQEKKTSSNQIVNSLGQGTGRIGGRGKGTNIEEDEDEKLDKGLDI